MSPVISASCVAAPKVARDSENRVRPLGCGACEREESDRNDDGADAKFVQLAKHDLLLYKRGKPCHGQEHLPRKIVRGQTFVDRNALHTYVTTLV